MSKHLIRVALAATLSASACQSAHEVAEVGEPDLPDAGPEAPDAAMPAVLPDDCHAATGKLDLLFVIDNSGSMAEEQQSLAAALPGLVRALTLGVEGGGQERAPVTSLHVGVVSTDMGSDGAYEYGACRGLGDDGLLLHDARGAHADDAACAEAFANGKTYLDYAPGEEPAQAAARAFACVATPGVNGCGLEQQLEAMHKALQPSSVHDFVSGGGHGDGENAGFLRADAVLAVVHVSDEDDCSITKAGRGLFATYPDDPRFQYDGEPAVLRGQLEGLNFRCAYEATQVESAGLLQPIERFVQGLASLKAPGQVVYAAVAGVPEEAEGMLVAGSDTQDFGAILALDAMQIRPGVRDCTEAEKQDPDVASECGQPGVAGANPPLPVPACVGDTGSASPGRRLVQVAQALVDRGEGDHAVVHSICNSDFSRFTRVLVDKIAAAVAVAGGCRQ